jgi:ribonuclease HI
MLHQYPSYSEIYTDGSKLEDGSCACAVYIKSLDTVHTWRLDPRHCIYSAELYAIKKALVFTREHSLSTKTVILTDSQSAIQKLLGGEPLNEIEREIALLIYECNTRHKVALQWVRAHCGIPGNEMADQAAKVAHANNRSALFRLTTPELLKELKTKHYRAWNDDWRRQVESTNTGQFLFAVRSSIGPRKWKFTRREEVALTRLRTGHAGVASYLHRFKWQESPLCRFCTVPEDIEHYLLHCLRFSASRLALEIDLAQVAIVNPTLEQLLSGGAQEATRQKVFAAILQYVRRTGRLNQL